MRSFADALHGGTKRETLTSIWTFFWRIRCFYRCCSFSCANNFSFSLKFTWTLTCIVSDTFGLFGNFQHLPKVNFVQFSQICLHLNFVCRRKTKRVKFSDWHSTVNRNTAVNTDGCAESFYSRKGCSCIIALSDAIFWTQIECVGIRLNATTAKEKCTPQRWSLS